MDYDKLVDDLRVACAGNQYNIMGVAALAIETLRAENENLRADLARVTAERDGAVEDLLDAAIVPCSYCERNPSNGGACDMDNDNHEMFSCWKWRGIEED